MQSQICNKECEDYDVFIRKWAQKRGVNVYGKNDMAG